MDVLCAGHRRVQKTSGEGSGREPAPRCESFDVAAARGLRALADDIEAGAGPDLTEALVALAHAAGPGYSNGAGRVCRAVARGGWHDWLNTDPSTAEVIARLRSAADQIDWPVPVSPVSNQPKEGPRAH